MVKAIFIKVKDKIFCDVNIRYDKEYIYIIDYNLIAKWTDIHSIVYDTNNKVLCIKKFSNNLDKI